MLTKEDWHVIAVLTRLAIKELPPEHEVADAFRMVGAFSTAVLANFAIEEEHRRS